MTGVEATEWDARGRSPSRAASYAVPLGVVSGVSLLALAILSVSNGELSITKQEVVVVVGVNALIKLVFAASLVILSRFSGRRLPGAFWGTWLISALCVPYLVLELLFKIPGFGVQVTLPGNNVLNTANLRLSLSGLRPPWHEPVAVALTLICLAALIVQVSVLVSAAARSRPRAGQDTT